MSSFKLILWLLLVKLIIGDCPTRCRCTVDTVHCQNKRFESVYPRDNLKTVAYFTDSEVDLLQLLVGYPHLQKISLKGSKVRGCEVKDRVVITGGCTERDSSHNFNNPNEDFMDSENDPNEDSIVGLSVSLAAALLVMLIYGVKRLLQTEY